MKKRNIVEIIICISILCICLVGTYNMLSFKYGDGIIGIKTLYKEEDSIDVLMLGSSHAFEDMNTGILYDEYGMAGFVLSGSIQPFWNTYYYLLEALETQSPRLVILEGYAASQNFEYSDYSRVIKNNFGIKSTMRRFSSLTTSTSRDQLDDFLFSYRYWHSRYEEVGANDFAEYYNRPLYSAYKGFGINFSTQKFEQPDVDSFVGEEPIYPKELEYFEKIVELCKSEDIPILVVVSPYCVSESEQKKYNYLENVCLEYNVDYLNFNSSEMYEKMEFDFSTDMADPGHVNYIGNEKYTRTLADYLIQNYNLPDRRGDKKYASWEVHSKDILERTRDNDIAKIDDFSALMNSIQNEDLVSYVMAISGSEMIKKANVDGCDFLSNIEDMSLYRFSENGLEIVNDNREDWTYIRELNGEIIKIECKYNVVNGINKSCSILYGKQEYIDDASGIYIFTYNKFTKGVVSVKQVDVDADGNVTVVSKTQK